jgi:hypothetical protein
LQSADTLPALQPEKMEEVGSSNLKPSVQKTTVFVAGKRSPMNPVSNVESFSRETSSAYSRANTFLQPNHLRLLLSSAISPEVSRSRGYQTVTKRSALRGYGFGPEQCRPPALLIPVYDGRGRLITYQIRPDEPRIDRHAGAVGYDVCPGRQFALDAPPSCASLLSDPSIPLYITDEVFKADSAASQGLCCVDLVGLLPTLAEHDVERRLSLSDWDGIVLDKRLVRFVYDADSSHRPQTRSAFATLQEFLWSRHARIQRINL